MASGVLGTLPGFKKTKNEHEEVHVFEILLYIPKQLLHKTVSLDDIFREAPASRGVHRASALRLCNQPYSFKSRHLFSPSSVEISDFFSSELVKYRLLGTGTPLRSP
ncbi:hypothetical protein PSTG_18286 [Puccinia striiformis f. sp. tritici PST-78]|uniref:Uncharacterized protein n=1 Tax=Puccinia striiformis f. sp. tritici PST-78 TaxID=1165861 RepID=A0A0L0UNG9_9BASI|nr:hypothetical protein PSTG_18286 [Puccinia striiformis f. sp. tritici PST-78]